MELSGFIFGITIMGVISSGAVLFGVVIIFVGVLFFILDKTCPWTDEERRAIDKLNSLIVSCWDGGGIDANWGNLLVDNCRFDNNEETIWAVVSVSTVRRRRSPTVVSPRTSPVKPGVDCRFPKQS